ncbi:hypothetical protein [Caballeronia arationis]|uniref:hypothetical protein n=1 Tax=Caballeronia arationis TaxID=1777142 RepID=UPI000B23C367|nr:hypothetical protein [Caballeronia arationis]
MILATVNLTRRRQMVVGEYSGQFCAGKPDIGQFGPLHEAHFAMLTAIESAA